MKPDNPWAKRVAVATEFREMVFAFHPEQQERFRGRKLMREWRGRYPFLFDERDEHVVRTDHQVRYHFLEWLCAVLMYESMGYHSLVEFYAFPSHRRKREVVEKLCAGDGASRDLIFSHGHVKAVQCPDLLVYRPDYSDWFFCDAKGPGDSLRVRQRSFFEELQRVTKRPVVIARFVADHRKLCLPTD